MNQKTLHQITWALVILGGVNWGLIGAFNIDLVNVVLGSWPGVERVVLVLVGLSAVYEVVAMQGKKR